METSLKEIYSELPGSAGVPSPPLQRFEELRMRRGEQYQPRTRHLHPDGRAKYTNRLFLETSPYLLQHAHNPVNWFPWGDEAFDLARKLGRPLLVSIGYATCHWCHVMEEESFEDEEIAAFLNRYYIAVKVDREERPDIDTVYMNALHAMGMQGGWPLNVFVTPDQKPFYGGTYFPPFDHSRGIGFPSLLVQLREVYHSDPERVSEAGLQLTQAVQNMLAPSAERYAERSGRAPNLVLAQAQVNAALQAYLDRFDVANGGLVGAPKFPSSLPLRLLHRQHRRTGNGHLSAMSHLTLQKMAAGGIYDQVGGGFHRYATDERWLVPHFEKMLYDNALLAGIYLEGYQVTGDVELSEVAGEILRYLQREMAAPQGGFYSATDADSLAESGRREEGFFFTWTPEEIFQALGRARGEIFATCYGITPQGNFEGRSIPHRDQGMAQLARQLDLGEEELRSILRECRETLYQLRGTRPAPLRDEKILTSWNGLAISAFARAGLILNDAGALEQARKTAGFFLESMTTGGRLAHSHQEGEPRGEAFLDDYAFFIAGLIDLFEVTGEALWLERALQLSLVVREDLADDEAGGFFLTGSRHEALIAREKPAYDGVVPSGNSVMIMNLLRLGALTEEPGYREQAERALAAFTPQLQAAPTALSEMLLAVDFLQESEKQVAIVAPQGNRQAAEELVQKLRRLFLPNCSLALVCEGAELNRAGELVPFLRGKKASGARAVAYLCQNKSCGLPTSDPEEFGRQLEQSEGRG